MQLRNTLLAAAYVCICLCLLAQPLLWPIYGFEYGFEPSTALAQDMPEVSVTPVVVNEKAKARDILKKELTIANNTSNRYDVYVTVEDIDPAIGEQEFLSASESDLSTSLAHWVEITRGVLELGPGEVKTVPYLIHVNMTAEPGVHNARISFTKGTNRKVAEEDGEIASLLLSVEVLDDARERIELETFMPTQAVFGGSEATFSFEVENAGNRPLAPKGEIRIFNRRGEEVGTVPVNAERAELAPNDVQKIAAEWDTSGRFGKYKAFLNIEYGDNQLATVYDTVYFWVFPWKEIGVAFGGLTVLAVLGTYALHTRQLSQVPRGQRGQYASAGSTEDDLEEDTEKDTDDEAAASSSVPSHVSGNRSRSAKTPRQAPLPQKRSTNRSSNHSAGALHSTVSAPTESLVLPSNTRPSKDQPNTTITLNKKTARAPEHVVTLASKRK